MLCYGDANGKVLPHLFERVIDAASGRQIYPKVSALLLETYIATVSKILFLPVELKLFSALFGPLGLRNCNENFVSLSVNFSIKLSLHTRLILC